MTEQQLTIENAPEVIIEANLYKLSKALVTIKADIEKLEAELARRAALAMQPKEEVVAEEPVAIEGEVIPAQG